MTGHRAATPRAEFHLPMVRVVRPGLLAAVVTGATLVLLTMLAMTSRSGAVVAVGAAVLLIGLVCLGITRTGEVLITLGVFLVPMNNLHPSGAVSFVTAADAAFLLGFAVMAPTLLGRPLRLPLVFVFGAGGLFTVALISSLLSEDPVVSLNLVVRLLVGAFGLSVLFMWWSPELKKVVTIAWAYVLGNAVSVAYGVIDGVATGDGRYLGLTEHPNILGLCSLLGLALVPFILAHAPSSSRWLAILAGGACAWGVWSSGSRAALGTLIAVAVVFPLLKRSLPAALALLAGFVLALTFSDRLLSESSTGNALGRLLGSGSADGSDQIREDAAALALDRFLSHPILGQGLVDALDAHVIYLQIAAAVGVIGLAFYVLVLWATVRPALDLAPPFNLLAVPALAYVIAGFVSPVLWDRYIWVLLALSLLAPRLVPPEDDESSAPDRTREAAISDGPT